MKNVVIFFCCVVYSCSSSSQIYKSEEINEVIYKFNNTDFSQLRGVSISIRSRGSNPVSEIVYIVHKSDDKLPVYFVTFNTISKTITDVNKANLKALNVKDYFTKEEIESIILKFRQFEIYRLKVDSIGNVFFNPFTANEPFVLLKMKYDSTSKTVKAGYSFIHYKANWFLNKNYTIK